jgi:hypothetical protein
MKMLEENPREHVIGKNCLPHSQEAKKGRGGSDWGSTVFFKGTPHDLKIFH